MTLDANNEYLLLNRAEEYKEGEMKPGKMSDQLKIDFDTNELKEEKSARVGSTLADTADSASSSNPDQKINQLEKDLQSAHHKIRVMDL